MNNISSISSSALRAYNISQQVTAHNVANLNTDKFKASRVTFQENGKSGVQAAVSSTQDTVDISREAIDLLSNRQGYRTNLKVFKTADDMTKQLLSIKV